MIADDRRQHPLPVIITRYLSSQIACRLAPKSFRRCFACALALRHALANKTCPIPSGYILLLRLFCAFLPILLAQGCLAEGRWWRCGRRRLSRRDAPDQKKQCEQLRKHNNRASHRYLHCRITKGIDDIDIALGEQAEIGRGYPVLSASNLPSRRILENGASQQATRHRRSVLNGSLAYAQWARVQ